MCPAQLRVLPYARSAPRPEQGEKPCTCVGSGAWGRRQGLAGLRDDAPSEARGADGERAGRRPQAPTRKQAREHKLHGRQAGSSRRGRRAGAPSRRFAARASRRRAERSSRRGRRAGGPPPPGANTQTRKRTRAPRTASGQLTARTPNGQLTARTPNGQLAARTPSGRAAAPRHQHAEHAHTTRPGPAAPNSAEDPGLVKQSDQAVHHEGGECFERSLDLALGQRGERCDSVIGPGARKFARLIEHVVGAQAFHNRGEGLVGG